jgi:hypothetical protein
VRVIVPKSSLSSASYMPPKMGLAASVRVTAASGMVTVSSAWVASVTGKVAKSSRPS